MEEKPVPVPLHPPNSTGLPWDQPAWWLSS